MKAEPETGTSKLQALRIARGYTREQLSVLAGVSRQTLYIAERAPHLMTLRTALLVAAALGVSPEELRA